MFSAYDLPSTLEKETNITSLYKGMYMLEDGSIASVTRNCKTWGYRQDTNNNVYYTYKLGKENISTTWKAYSQ